jgi:pimeloyl-ACP methyl ester carboxylesterase
MVRQEGAGMTTWVFLRGLTREARHWGDFPVRFQAAFAGELDAADIVCPDLPGNGRLHAAVSPISIDAMVESCRATLKAQGRPPPYHLLALSLGGMVALAWAARHAEECRAAVLISTSVRPYCTLLERLRPQAWSTLLRLLPARGIARERAILELTSARASESQSLLPIWADYARESPVTRLGAMRQLLAAARFAMPQRPAVPLLILAGAADRMVHPDCSRRLARIWQADFALHPGAGHDVPLDAGEWVAREVRRWIEGVQTTDAAG